MKKLFHICLITFSIAQAVSAQSHVKTNPVSANYHSKPLSEIFDELKAQYQIKIAYDAKLVSDITVTTSFDSLSMSQAISQILGGTKLEYRTVNNKIVIIPSPKRFFSKKGGITVSGIIIDNMSGEALPNAMVKVKGMDLITTSNVDGHFTLLRIPSDTSQIEIHYLGYTRKTIEARALIGKGNPSIKMESSHQVLKGITVTGGALQAMEISNTPSKIAYNPLSITSLPSLGETDLFRNLQLLPGISGSNETSSGLIIRGGAPWQNMVLMDGFTIYHLDHFFGVYSAINTDVIKDVQIFKGGFGAKYGGRVTSVIDITGKSGNNLKPEFRLGLNMISARAMVELPISPKWSILVAARRSYTDIIKSRLYQNVFEKVRENDEILNIDPEIDGVPASIGLSNVEPEFYFYDFNAKITHKPNDRDTYSLSLYGGQDILLTNNEIIIDSVALRITLDGDTTPVDYTYRERISEKANWGNSGISFKWGRQWNEKFYSNLRLSASSFFSNYFYQYNFNYIEGLQNNDFETTFEQVNDISDFNLSFDNEFLLNEDNTFGIGVHRILHSVTSETKVNINEVTSSDEQFVSVRNYYVTWKNSIIKNLSAELGLRFNAFDLTSGIFNEPRLSLNYKISDLINLKFASGKYYQFVNQVQLDNPYSGTQTYWALANEGDNIPVLEAEHFIIGGSYEKNGYLLDLELYSRNTKGLIEAVYLPYFNDTTSSVFELYHGRERVSGLDFLLKKTSTKYTGWIAYTLSKAQRSFDEIENGDYYTSLNDQRHELKLVNILKLGKWNLSSSWVYGSGRPYARSQISYVYNTEGIITDFVISRDYQSEKRVPSYHRLDLSAGYVFNVGKFNFETGLSIFNLYNRNNIKTRKLNIGDPVNNIGKLTPQEASYRNLQLLDLTLSTYFNIKF